MKFRMIFIALAALLCLASCSDDDSGIQLTEDEVTGDIITGKQIVINLNSATVSINRLSDSKLSLWCLGALFDCCISRDKPFHPLTPPSDLRQYAVENRQEIRISQSLY